MAAGVGGRECFVLMPLGRSLDDESRSRIDFDAICERAVEPAVREAGFRPRRIDRRALGSVLDSSTIWRALTADVLVADLTTTDPTITYLLGMRHAARAQVTIPLVGNPPGTVFDTGVLEPIRYRLTGGSLLDEHADALRVDLLARLRAAADTPAGDSPAFTLLDGYPGVALSWPSTAAASAERDAILLERLADAASRGSEQVRAVETEVGHLPAAGRGVLTALVAAYSTVESWPDVLRVHDQLPASLSGDVDVQRRVAWALAARNGPGDGDAAVAVLQRAVEASGGDAPALTALGRAYKERLAQARSEGDVVGASIWLEEAVDAFTKAFERDPADYYAGVNAINLLVQKGNEEAMTRVERLAPVVTFSALRCGCHRSDDYWTLATILELALLDRDEELAGAIVDRLLEVPGEEWMRSLTADNIGRLAELGRPDEHLSLLDDLRKRLQPPELAGQPG